MSTNVRSLNVHLCLLLMMAVLPSLSAIPRRSKNIPDFTKGDTIPRMAKHDWNLGSTGARGWIYTKNFATTAARQIMITQVEEGSPAAAMLKVGDVILGVRGKAFSYDPRTEMGIAINWAEKEENEGALSLIRWRKGEKKNITLTLAVMGNYASTAPYSCSKSKRILELGCRALAKRVTDPDYSEIENAITRSLNALALLASGDQKYKALIKSESTWAASYSADSMQVWYYGFVIMFLSEYKMATGDESVMPGLKRLALASAKGQSAVGSWGHNFATADGRLEGYGMMNTPGLILTISLDMARSAGVKDAALDLAIERSAKLYRFYIGKGAVPYGDHEPWLEGHEDNGKSGMAAFLFNALGNVKGAEFFSRLSTAAYGTERDAGHAGNYFNILWALPSIALSGPNASGEWMNEFGYWYFDLARRWDGSFIHQGPPEKQDNSFAGWDSSGAYLLAYALPLKQIRLTGKIKSIIPQLSTKDAKSVVEDGRGSSQYERDEFYGQLSTNQLLKRLSSWSPIVREQVAMTLDRREENFLPQLLKLLSSSKLESRYGACQALAALGEDAAEAVDPLRKTLKSEDLWLRIKAAEALAAIGKPAMKVVPDLLELLAQVDKKNDPRGMQQRYLSHALFNDGGMLHSSLDGVDHELLFRAVRAGLKNQDGHARASIGSIYRKLSLKEITPLLPAVYQAIVEPAPSGIMFASGIRLEGLEILAAHRIEEGMQACADYVRSQNPWESQIRTPDLMEILLSYGKHAQTVIPELEKIAAEFDDGEEDFPMKLSIQKAAVLRKTIKAIQKSTENPKLISINLVK